MSRLCGVHCYLAKWLVLCTLIPCTFQWYNCQSGEVIPWLVIAIIVYALYRPLAVPLIFTLTIVQHENITM